MCHLYGCFLMYNNKYMLVRNIWSINQNFQGLWLIFVSGVRKIAFTLSQAIPALGSSSNHWHWGHKPVSIQSLLFSFPYNFLRHSPLGLKFSKLSLCLRRALDSYILGGTVQMAVRGIIFPSLLCQGQWDNICKVAWKSSFSPERWIQPTAGRSWLRQAYKHTKKIVSSMNSKELHGKKHGIAPDQDSIPAQKTPILIGGLLHSPGIIPNMGMGQGAGTSPREHKSLRKMPGPPWY